MAKGSRPKHIPHKDKNIAYHMEWGFRREAAIWVGKRPIGPNLHPLGTELRNWMLRQGTVRILSLKDNRFTNPYTCGTSILAGNFVFIVNDCAEFGSSTEPITSLDAELRCTRLYMEYVLYMARLCEALIKQILYCTTFPEKDYKYASLGGLLSSDCSGCSGSKDKGHKVSLLGSVAHRYGLCNAYEKCLNQHVKIVNRRRNIEAAHSGITKFAQKFARTPNPDVRKQFENELIKMGNDFVHMLQHISDFENKMLAELNPMIVAGEESVCPVVNALEKGRD